MLASNAEAMAMLDEALTRPAGGENNPDGLNQHQQVVTVDNVHIDHKHPEVPTRPAGNSRDRAIRKLRKDAPELLQQVIAGVKSAHAEAVK